MGALSILLMVIGAYLVSGLAAIALLDLLTGRVRTRLKDASVQTEVLVGEGRKTALVVTLLALWWLWPVAIYASVAKR